MSRMCSRGSSSALRRPLAVLACLALLCGAAVAAGCDTEQLAKVQAASSLPFTVDYQRSGKVDTTTFYFKVCSACPAGGAACQPLKAFRVRLADAVLAAPKQFVQSASPAGTVSATCAAGPGWWLKDVELGVLSEAPTDDECELFEVTVFNQGGKTTPLSAICQQHVVVQDAATGATVFDQATAGASCMYALELADGSVGVGALHDAEQDAVTAPPPHRPTPSHPTTPGYYYGASVHARRLQQAPFTVRSLLTAYYGGYSAHRRLASVEVEADADSPVVFATRRLMEASIVPLPRHLKEAARVPSHLTGGRQLSSYYYQGAATQHRRSLMGLQPGSLFGRTLTTYYYGAGHRRSLMNVGQDAALGTSGRTLSTYYYGAGHRRSLMSAGARTLNTYYYGSHRRMLSVGQEATLGSARSLQTYGGYYAGAGHRRSLMSSNTGRTLTSYYYSGNSHRRSLMSLSGTAGRTLTSYYGYTGSAHRRSLMSANGAGRTLTTYYYGGASTAHRRSLLSSGAASRHLSTYYYGGASTAHRRSLLASGAASRHLITYYYGGASTAHRRSLLSPVGRQLSTYYYGGASAAHRRSLLSSGAASRHLSTYYYGGASTAHRRLMSVGQEAGLGRSLLHSGYGYYGNHH